jgi:hypothetical protein
MIHRIQVLPGQTLRTQRCRAYADPVTISDIWSYSRPTRTSGNAMRPSRRLFALAPTVKPTLRTKMADDAIKAFILLSQPSSVLRQPYFNSCDRGPAKPAYLRKLPPRVQGRYLGKECGTFGSTAYDQRRVRRIHHQFNDPVRQIRYRCDGATFCFGHIRKDLAFRRWMRRCTQNLDEHKRRCCAASSISICEAKFERTIRVNARFARRVQLIAATHSANFSAGV